MIARETKAGLVVSCSFMCLVGVVLYSRLTEKGVAAASTESGPQSALAPPDPTPTPQRTAEARVQPVSGTLPALEPPPNGLQLASNTDTTGTHRVPDAPPAPMAVPTANPEKEKPAAGGPPAVPPPAPPPGGDNNAHANTENKNGAVAAPPAPMTAGHGDTGPAPVGQGNPPAPAPVAAAVPAPDPVHPGGIQGFAVPAPPAGSPSGVPGAPANPAPTPNPAPAPTPSTGGFELSPPPSNHGAGQPPPVPPPTGAAVMPTPAPAPTAMGGFALPETSTAHGTATTPPGAAAGTNPAPAPAPTPTPTALGNPPPAPSMPTPTHDVGAVPPPIAPPSATMPAPAPTPGAGGEGFNVPPPASVPAPAMAMPAPPPVNPASLAPVPAAIPNTQTGAPSPDSNLRSATPPNPAPGNGQLAQATGENRGMLPFGGGSASVVTTPMIAGGYGQVPTQTPQVDSYDEQIHRTRPGDSFAAISQQYYEGSDRYAQALLQFNRNHPMAAPGLAQDPVQLKPEQMVFIPPKRILEKYYASSLTAPAAAQTGPGSMAAASDRFYKVRAGGERFRDIAQRTLRDPERWNEIYQRNLAYNPAFAVPAGTMLKLPGDATIAPEDIPR